MIEMLIRRGPSTLDLHNLENFDPHEEILFGGGKKIAIGRNLIMTCYLETKSTIYIQDFSVIPILL